MKINLLNLNTLTESSLDVDVVSESLSNNMDLISTVIKWQLANRRGFSSAKTKTVSEIAYTGKKPFNQKGRGSARQGSLKGAQFVGGAKAFGPRPRDFSYTLPKKIVKKALKIVLCDKIFHNKLVVVEGLNELPISTNSMSKKFNDKKITNPLIICQDKVENFFKSVRNIKNTKLIKTFSAINVYDLMNHDSVLLDRTSYDRLTKEVLL